MKYLAVVYGGWGKHDDKEKAMKIAMKEAGLSKLPKQRLLYVVADDAYVDLYGYINHKEGEEPKLIEEHK